MPGRNYRDLVAWQKAMDLVILCYKRTESFPRLETHILIANRLNYINDNRTQKILSITEEIGKMLNGLRKAIESKL